VVFLLCGMFLAFSPSFAAGGVKAAEQDHLKGTSEASNVISCLEMMQKNSFLLFENQSLSIKDKKTINQNVRSFCHKNLEIIKEYSDKNGERVAFESINSHKDLARFSLESSYNIKTSAINAQVARDLYNQAIAQRNPQLNFSISASMYSQNYFQCAENDYLEVGISCDTAQGLEPFDEPFNYYQIGSIDENIFTLTYDLINIKQDKIIKSESKSVEMSDSKLLTVYDKQIADVFELYDQIIKLEQVLIVRVATQKLYEDSLDIVKQQLKTGYSTIVDLYKIESKLGLANGAVTVAEVNLAKAKAKINNKLSKISFEIDNPLFISNTFNDLEWQETDVLLENAIKSSPDIKKLEHEALAYKYQSDAQIAGLYPSVNLSVGYSPQFTGVLYKGLMDESRETSLSGSIGINWKIFDSRLSQIKSESMERKMNATLLKLEQLKIEKTNNITDTSNNIRLGITDMNQKYKSVLDASNAMRGTRIRLYAGFEDVTSYIQTVDTLVDTQLQYYASIFYLSKMYRALAFESHSLENSGISEILVETLQDDLSDNITASTDLK